MPSLKRNKSRFKIFLDSSVIIAAVLSFSGGSFRLIRESLSANYRLLISGYVLDECSRILKLKYPERVALLIMFLNNFRFQIVEEPSPNEVQRLVKFINLKDAPILASAIKHKVDYLITLDKKDFQTPKLLELAKKYNFSIFTPKEYFKLTEGA